MNASSNYPGMTPTARKHDHRSNDQTDLTAGIGPYRMHEQVISFVINPRFLLNEPNGHR